MQEGSGTSFFSRAWRFQRSCFGRRRLSVSEGVFLGGGDDRVSEGGVSRFQKAFFLGGGDRVSEGGVSRFQKAVF